MCIGISRKYEKERAKNQAIESVLNSTVRALGGGTIWNTKEYLRNCYIRDAT